MRKSKHFVKFLKKINLFINNLLEKYLNKLKFKNLSKIARSNKVFLTFIVLIILFLSYLSIPYIHNKVEIREELKNQLFEKFNINFVFSKNFNYKFFPRPQFIIEDSSIIYNQIEMSNVKKLRILVSLDNLFSLKNITIKNVILENTNFNLNNKNYNFFTKLLDKNFLESSLKIKDSNIFYRNTEKEVLFLNKIVNMKYYYDPKELKNIIYSENEIFNIPYSFTSHKNKLQKKIFSKLNLNFLNIQIKNEIEYKDYPKKGSINFIYSNNKSNATYELNRNYFIFNFKDKLIDPNFIYEGNIQFNPFYSTIKGNVEKLNLSALFRSNSLFIQFLKTKILNNKNLNIDLKINGKKISQFKNFINIFLKFKIQEGLIDIDNTKFSWNNYVDFQISDSLIYLIDNNLVVDAKLIVNVKNYNEVYKFLQTSKNLKPELKKLEFDFNYNFDQQIMNFNNIKIDNQTSQKVNNVLNKIILKKDKLQNKIYLKQIMNQVIAAYAG